MSDCPIRDDIRQFVVSNLLLGDATFIPRDSESFVDSGTIDSTGVLEIVMFLEQHFGLKIDDRELIPENLDSVDRLTAFVTRKRHAA